MSLEISVIRNPHAPKHIVLWVSRHPPLPAQIKELEEKLGSVKIVQIRGVVANAEEVMKYAKQYNADYIVPVLPLSFIARLLEVARRNGITLLFAKMNAIAEVSDPDHARLLVEEAPDRRTMTTYADGTIKVHEFERFEVIKEVRIVTEPF